MSTKMFADVKPKETTNPQTQTQPQQNAQNTRQQAPQKKTFSMFSMFNVAPKASKDPAIQAEQIGRAHVF